jgi:hypothetical protein
MMPPQELLDRVKQAFGQLKAEVINTSEIPTLATVAVLGGVALLVAWACWTAY